MSEMGPLQLHDLKEAISELYNYYREHQSDISYTELKATK